MQSLHIYGSASLDSTNCESHSTVIFTTEKKSTFKWIHAVQTRVVEESPVVIYCITNYPKTQWLQTMHIFYLTVSEVRKCDRSWLDVPAQELWRGAVKSAVSPGPVLLGFNSERFCVSACSVAVGRTWFLGTVGWRPHLLARWMVHSTLAGLTSVGARERRCSANAVTSAQKGTPPAGEGSFQCDHRRWGPLEHLQQLTSQRPTYS